MTEEQKIEKAQDYMKKYGLTDLSDRDMESIRSICYNAVAGGLFQIGSLFDNTNAGQHKTNVLLEMIVAQNWMIIRHLDSLARKK